MAKSLLGDVVPQFAARGRDRPAQRPAPHRHARTRTKRTRRVRARARQAKQNVNDVGRIVARVEMRNHSALRTLLVVEAVRAGGMQRREPLARIVFKRFGRRRRVERLTQWIHAHPEVPATEFSFAARLRGGHRVLHLLVRGPCCAIDLDTFTARSVADSAEDTMATVAISCRRVSSASSVASPSPAKWRFFRTRGAFEARAPSRVRR